MFNEVTVNARKLIFQCLNASYIRVMLELNRIANHLLWLGPLWLTLAPPFFYIFRERR